MNNMTVNEIRALPFADRLAFLSWIRVTISTSTQAEQLGALLSSVMQSTLFAQTTSDEVPDVPFSVSFFGAIESFTAAQHHVDVESHRKVLLTTVDRGTLTPASLMFVYRLIAASNLSLDASILVGGQIIIISPNEQQLATRRLTSFVACGNA